MYKRKEVLGLNKTLLPCTEETLEMLQNLQKMTQSKSVGVSMNCTMKNNTLTGFHCILPKNTPVSLVPIPVNIFECITVVETLASEREILHLLNHRKETLKKLYDFACDHQSVNVGESRLSWQRCRPKMDLPFPKQDNWHVKVDTNNLMQYLKVDKDATIPTIDLPRLCAGTNLPLVSAPDETLPNFVDSGSWTPELGVGGQYCDPF